MTQTAAQELSSAPPANSVTKKEELSPCKIKTEPGTEPEIIPNSNAKLVDAENETERPNRPNTANSFSSGTSADSIPPLPPLPHQTLTGKRTCVITSLADSSRFPVSYLANSSTSVVSKPEPVRNLTKRTLHKANSDSQAMWIKHNGSLLNSDRDSQLIGVTPEQHLGPQCLIRRKINFETDDSLIKTFQLYWYVDASKGCLESPILSNSNKRIHGNPIETPYFVITKNQRRHQAYRKMSN